MRILGTFRGYAPGVVHRLDDGSEWEQMGPKTHLPRLTLPPPSRIETTIETNGPSPNRNQNR